MSSPIASTLEPLQLGHVRGKAALDIAWLADLHIVNPALAAIEQGTEPDPRTPRMVEPIRERYRGPLIMAGGLDHDTAETGLKQVKADRIAFGRRFLANPGLPERFGRRAPVNADDRSTYEGGGAKGYTDDTTLAQGRGEEPKPCVDDRWR